MLRTLKPISDAASTHSGREAEIVSDLISIFYSTDPLDFTASVNKCPLFCICCTITIESSFF